MVDNIVCSWHGGSFVDHATELKALACLSAKAKDGLEGAVEGLSLVVVLIVLRTQSEQTSGSWPQVERKQRIVHAIRGRVLLNDSGTILRHTWRC